MNSSAAATTCCVPPCSGFHCAPVAAYGTRVIVMERCVIWSVKVIVQEPGSVRQQVKDIRADLRGIRIPLILPVAIHLPIWPREPVMVGAAPVTNSAVRGTKTAIRSKVRRPCCRAGGRCRENDWSTLDKGPQKLHSDFKPDAPIPIDSDVASRPRLLRTHFVPDEATALWHHTRKLGRARLALDDSKGNTIKLPELNGVGVHETFVP
ncbi:exported hypothetical protein [Candidatus Sulfotelmatomonas gaucii]|uniref:Uncharacterized protein n=1 Tax=Candidatus Sulfuritelmatomonas gaucii TaxID=2043161 RepID=A0A2N9L4Z0_9BACT|nr:exported hypothetical protein [Candidatus Sulfotelmatomonas gaucii]